MKAVTIDNFDLEVHAQYARGKGLYDPQLVHDAQSVLPNCEIDSTSLLYSSKWEELFEIGSRNVPWALFVPPTTFGMQSKRYFRFRILPSIEECCTEEEDEEQEVRSELVEKILSAKRERHQALELFEKERDALLHFVASVRSLNTLLSQINARKLQYQKG